MVATEQVVGIDVRPATGQLYALGLVDDGATRTGRIYTIDPATGAATQVGGAPWTTTYPDSDFGGFNFNPTVDLIRVISRDGPNFRVSPVTGALVGTDTNTSETGLNGVSYTNNSGFCQTTTLYGLDFDDDLVTVGGLNGTPSPNGGQVTVVGDTAVTAGDAYGFEITSVGAVTTAFATADQGGTSKLYTVNLTTGARGTTLTYTVMVTNNAAFGIAGVSVNDTILPQLTGVTWTAVFSAGSSGAAAGTGSISGLVTLAAGGTVTYTVTATVAPAATGTITNTAVALVPAGLTDSNPNDNAATDSTLVLTQPATLIVTGPLVENGLLYTPSGQYGSPVTIPLLASFGVPVDCTSRRGTSTGTGWRTGSWARGRAWRRWWCSAGPTA